MYKINNHESTNKQIGFLNISKDTLKLQINSGMHIIVRGTIAYEKY